MSQFQSIIGRRKVCPVPGIFWHERSQQFVSQVGYHEAKSMDRKGRIKIRRVRSTQTLGPDQAEAIGHFIQIKRQWDALKKEYRRQRKTAGPLERFVPLPVWPPKNNELQGVWVAQPATNQPSGSVGFAPAPQSQPTQNAIAAVAPVYPRPTIPAQAVLSLTIEQAKDKFLNDYRSRIGLRAGKGISENTYFKFTQNLNLALALNPQYSRNRRPIDVKRTLAELTYEDYKAFVNFWVDPANVASERTSMNYIGAFKRMLDGLKVPLPEDVDELFQLRVTTLPHIVKYNPQWLKALLSYSNERARLYQLMALNFGAYQCDICRLQQKYITDFDGLPYQTGEMFITRRRERTRHRNNFATTTFVWPETEVLMEKYRARPNPHDAYFLSIHGLPYDEDTISYIVAPAIHAAGLQGQFSFKQWRKIGASQVKALGGSDAMHQYKANALSAADQPYILEDYSILTRALKAFREKLLADGVL